MIKYYIKKRKVILKNALSIVLIFCSLVFFVQCSNKRFFKKGLVLYNEGNYLAADPLFKRSLDKNDDSLTCVYYSETRLKLGDTCTAFQLKSACSEKEAIKFKEKYEKHDSVFYLTSELKDFADYSVISVGICSKKEYQVFYKKSKNTDSLLSFVLFDSELQRRVLKKGQENVFNISDIRYLISDKKPEFPGGDEALVTFIGTKMKYPNYAIDNLIQGTVDVQFTIDKKGYVKEVIVLNKVHESLKSEAIRVVQDMPQWTPGMVDNKAVEVIMEVPLKFMLSL